MVSECKIAAQEYVFFLGEFCLTSRIFFGYQCYNPHWSRDALSLIRGIFILYYWKYKLGGWKRIQVTTVSAWFLEKKKKIKIKNTKPGVANAVLDTVFVLVNSWQWSN